MSVHNAIGQGTLALNSNYTLSFVGANLTVNTRPITVTGRCEVEDLRQCGSALTYQITVGSLAFSDAFSAA
jgi:hypothetical protein